LASWIQRLLVVHQHCASQLLVSHLAESPPPSQLAAAPQLAVVVVAVAETAVQPEAVVAAALPTRLLPLAELKAEKL